MPEIAGPFKWAMVALACGVIVAAMTGVFG